MEEKLLVVCPSRGRAERIKSMIKTYEETVDFDYTRLQILLDKDDKDLKYYFKNLPDWAQIKVFNREYDNTYTTEIINRAFMQDNHYEFYSVINDDIEFRTKGWDKAFCNKGKISTGIDDSMVKRYGEERVADVDIKGFPIISGIDGDIPRALGWLQYPKLRHSAGDNIWYWIARRLNILQIDEDVHWEHMSAYFGTGEEDETFKRTNAYNNMDDYYVYRDWLKYKIHKDLEKIKHNAPHLFINKKENEHVNELSTR